MDIPAEVVWIVAALVGLGVILAVIIFFSFHGGTFRLLDFIGGFSR